MHSIHIPRHTWFDRDLGLAGRVITGNQSGDKLQEHLVLLNRPILRIPNLAIHLDGSVREAFKFNTELQLNPILATTAFGGKETSSEVGDSTMHEGLAKLLKAHCKAGGMGESILSTDLCLFDCQPAAIGGLNEEFIHSARLDNLMLSFCSIEVMSR